MFIILIIYGCIGVNLFSTLPYRSEIHNLNNFRDFFSSIITLFKILTGEGWNNIMEEASFHECLNFTKYENFTNNYNNNNNDSNYSNYLNFNITSANYNYFCQKFNITCNPNPDHDVTYEDLISGNGFSCGTNFSFIYFTSFMIICSLLVMNLCIVMVVEGFSESAYEDDSLLSQEEMDKFISVWISYDKNFKKRVMPHEFVLILKELPPPLGYNYDRFFIRDPKKYDFSSLKVKNYKKILEMYSKLPKNKLEENQMKNMGEDILKQINNLFFGKENLFNKINIKDNDNDNDIENDIDIVNDKDKDKDFMEDKNNKKNSDERNCHKKFSEYTSEKDLRLIRQILKMLFNGSLKNLENSFQINNFFFSKNMRHFTSNLEILKLMDMFKFINYDKNLSGKENKKDMIIDSDLYISFVDACLALSRLVIAKRNNIAVDKLKDRIVEKFTQKLWIKKYEKECFVENKNKLEKENNNNLISEKIGFRIIDMTKKNLLDRLYAARERIKLRKEEERIRNILIRKKKDNFTLLNKTLHNNTLDIKNTLVHKNDYFKFTINDKDVYNKNSESYFKRNKKLNNIENKNNNNNYKNMIQECKKSIVNIPHNENHINYSDNYNYNNNNNDNNNVENLDYFTSLGESDNIDSAKKNGK
jgi:hypothetical protein